MLLASSTVMTPSLPTLSMASASSLPISSSELALMVPTWAISVLDLILVASLAICSTATATALSMPFLISVGLAPDAVTLRPSRKIASVRTVAVVVPSPATLEDLSATSLTIAAPICSNGSLSSTSLATVTPSLVTFGAPNDFSMTTTLPVGPMVTLTASLRVWIPVRILRRASSPNIICLAIVCIP